VVLLVLRVLRVLVEVMVVVVVAAVPGSSLSVGTPCPPRGGVPWGVVVGSHGV
jgi:hypothetical protein